MVDIHSHSEALLKYNITFYLFNSTSTIILIIYNLIIFINVVCQNQITKIKEERKQRVLKGSLSYVNTKEKRVGGC